MRIMRAPVRTRARVALAKGSAVPSHVQFVPTIDPAQEFHCKVCKQTVPFGELRHSQRKKILRRRSARVRCDPCIGDVGFPRHDEPGT